MGISLFQPATSITLLEQMKSWCNIQVIINPLLQESLAGPENRACSLTCMLMPTTTSHTHHGASPSGSIGSRGDGSCDGAEGMDPWRAQLQLQQFPRSSLRMIKKLGEGKFGLVSFILLVPKEHYSGTQSFFSFIYSKTLGTFIQFQLVGFSTIKASQGRW